MQKRLFRTNTANLSPDELLILDVLFDGDAPVRSLRRDSFELTFNSQCHALDDNQLRSTLHRLIDEYILFTSEDDGISRVGLTKYGGSLWALERCPIWEKYAIERYGETVSGRPFITICTTSPSILDDILRIGGPGRPWRADTARVRKYEITRHNLIYWHPFPRAYVAVVMNAVSDEQNDTWENMRIREDFRTWWRNVREMQKFMPQSE
jgi:hypothetical protein